MGEITSKKNAAVFNAKLGGVRILLIPGQNFASAPEHSPVLMFFYGIISEQTWWLVAECDLDLRALFMCLMIINDHSTNRSSIYSILNYERWQDTPVIPGVQN